MTSIPPMTVTERREHPVSWIGARPEDRAIRDAARVRVRTWWPALAETPEPMCRRDCDPCWTRWVNLYGRDAARAAREAMPHPPSDTAAVAASRRGG